MIYPDADDDTPPDGPEPQRRLPPLANCECCGRRRFTWTCLECGLHLCDAHPACECGRERDR